MKHQKLGPVSAARFTMDFRPFERRDFNSYLAWFDDVNLNHQLGPMNKEWLEHVMACPKPVQYSLFQNQELVAVTGIEYPKLGQRTWFITDIAVDPKRKRQGFAKNSLQCIIDHFASTEEHPLKWVAWVDTDNEPAKKFFRSLGWLKSESTSSENLYQFSLETRL